MSGFDVEMR